MKIIRRTPPPKLGDRLSTEYGEVILDAIMRPAGLPSTGVAIKNGDRVFFRLRDAKPCNTSPLVRRRSMR